MQTSRRTLLASAALAALGWNWRSALASVAVADDSNQNDSPHLLVSIFLRGGADGLSIVPPVGEDLYYRNRPTLAIGKPQAIPIDGFFGMHPAMSALEPLYKTGELAIVHACGSGDTTLSHFDAMATMERGLRQDSSTGLASGWLARHLSLTEEAASTPLRAVAIGDVTPQSLAGALRQTTFQTLSDLDVDFSFDGGQARNIVQAVYRKAAKSDIGQAGLQSLAVLKRLDQLSLLSYKPSGGANYPIDDLGAGLRQTAMLAKSEVGLEVACLDHAGYDTHVAQGSAQGQLASLLETLSSSIAAFRADMGSLWANTTVVVLSEFGRRVEENSGLGTDHGRGSVMMVMGGHGVRGGKVYGKWPSLEPSDLDTNGNLKVTTDYRNVLAEVLKERCGNPRATLVFPGLEYRPLGLAA